MGNASVRFDQKNYKFEPLTQEEEVDGILVHRSINATCNDRKQRQNQKWKERTLFMLKTCVRVCVLVIAYYLGKFYDSTPICGPEVLQSPNIQKLNGSAVSRESVNYGSGGSAVLEHPKVCVTIRTYAAHKIILPALIGSLEQSFTAQKFFKNIHYFIVNTDVTTSSQSQEMIIDTLQKYSFSDRSQATHLIDLQPHEGDYGYMVTQEVLSYQRECDFVMFTNGDNLYNQALFGRLGYVLQKDEYDIISFAFVSHYGNEAKLDGTFKKNHIDLGAAIIKMETIVKNDINFYKAMIKDGFAADWYFFEQIVKLKNVKRKTLPNILLFHQ